MIVTLLLESSLAEGVIWCCLGSMAFGSFENRQPWTQVATQQSLAGETLEGSLTSMSLSFHTNEMGMTVPISQSCWEE